MSPAFTFAFQPIIDISSSRVIAHEALIRGLAGEAADSVLAGFAGDELLKLDHEARITAIRLASSLHLRTGLSLNFSPRVLDRLPHSIHDTIAAAREVGLHPEQLILEVTEGAVIDDPAQFSEQINEYRSEGVRLAIDDFGAGYAGLNLLAEFQPDIVKIDMALVRSIDGHGPRQAIVRAVIQACDELGLDVIAEGIETHAEFRWFAKRGVRLFQGYLFGRPTLGRLSEPLISSTTEALAIPVDVTQ